MPLMPDEALQAAFFSNAAAPYRNLPGDSPKVYRSLCYLLSQRGEQIAWHSFTPQDWQLLAKMAVNEGVAPLVYWQYRHSRFPAAMPAAVRETVTNAYYKTLAHNTILYEELQRILSAFEAAGIPVILLKGAALAQTVYPDIGLRPMGDLDLLICLNHLPDVEKILNGMGYADVGSELWRGFNRLFAYEKNFARTLQGRPIAVEPHWNLIGGEASRVRPKIEWFWQGAQGNHLQPEAHVLYLAAHAFIKSHAHLEARLLWFVDAALLLQQHPVDWETVIAQAQKFNWLPALPALSQALDAVWGDSFALNAALPKAAASPNGLHARTGADFAERKQKRTGLLTSWGRVLLFIGMLFPSPQYMRTRYRLKSNWQLPLYYLKRLAQGARQV